MNDKYIQLHQVGSLLSLSISITIFLFDDIHVRPFLWPLCIVHNLSGIIHCRVPTYPACVYWKHVSHGTKKPNQKSSFWASIPNKIEVFFAFSFESVAEDPNVTLLITKYTIDFKIYIIPYCAEERLEIGFPWTSGGTKESKELHTGIIFYWYLSDLVGKVF